MSQSREYVKISFAGDIMCLKEQNEKLSGSKDLAIAYFDTLKAVKPLFADSDYVIGNLETPVCSSGLSDAAICFNTPIEFVKAVKECGFNFVSTANNHCLDRGVDGIDETIDNLDHLGIEHSGTYKTPIDANRLFTREMGGVNWPSFAAPLEQIQNTTAYC